jgi:short subunit dehydrogenase-like uncharacterized protein
MDALEFDVVVFGSTGFTGRLVAEYISGVYGNHGTVRWAMAGRDLVQLEAVRREIGAATSLPLVPANARDADSLRDMVRRSKVVLSTVGPYQVHGERLLAACAEAGTDYVDLCGEPAWMAAMIPKYEKPAQASGARIVFSCGFDSIPFDLGVYFLQRAARERFGAPCSRVRGRVRKMVGSLSGGTIASALLTLEASRRDAAVLKAMSDPYALVADPPGTRQPGGDRMIHEADVPGWSVPFDMAPINTKNIHRSNALMAYAYGREFIYDEMQVIGSDPGAERRAHTSMRRARVQDRLLDFALTRAVLKRLALPKPGQGPSRGQRDRGMYEILFIGTTSDGRTLRATVSANMDPGYSSTSRMISEAALCIGGDVPRDQTPGGVWTPAAAMGGALLPRLEKAGIHFRLEG